MNMQPDQLAAMSQALSSIPHLTGWLAAWPKARAEFEGLIAEYRERCPTGDVGRLELMLDTTDRTLYELHHRLAWLEAQLHAGTTPQN